MAALGHGPKSLSEAKLKSFRLMALTEDLSRQLSINCVMWLLVSTPMLFYTKMELNKEKYKLYSSRRKEHQKYSGAKTSAQVDEMFKKRIMMLNGIKEVETPGTRPHLTKLPTCEKE